MASILKKNKSTAHIPIIFCTAKDTEEDTLKGLDLGADDYISKPFSVKEIVARVKAILRRNKPQDNPQENKSVQYKTLFIDIAKKKASVDNREIALTRKEFEILYLFLQNPDKVFSRDSLLDQVWSDDVYVNDRTVDVHITRLRKKLIPYDKNITTRLGYGYCFEF